MWTRSDFKPVDGHRLEGNAGHVRRNRNHHPDEGLYFASTAFVLALRDRAFIEFGSGAMKAGNLGDLPDTLLSQERAMEVLSGIVYDMRDSRDDREDE